MNYELHHGDCLDILPTLEAGSVDAVITDPPYGIDYQCTMRTDKTAWFNKIINDDRPFVEFLPDASRTLNEKGCAIVFCRWDVQENFRNAMNATLLYVNAQLIWDRVAHGAGDLFGSPAPCHDVMLFGRMPEYLHYGQRPTSVYRFMRVPGLLLRHPNEKPVDLMAALICDYCPPGGTVLDPFMGSGTTGVAAMRTGRNFIGIELDAEYFRIAEQRIKNAAGEFVLTDREKQTGQLALFKGD